MSAADHGNDVRNGVAEHDELEPIGGVDPTQDQADGSVGDNAQSDDPSRLIERASQMKHDEERRGDRDARRSASMREPDDNAHGAEMQHDLVTPPIAASTPIASS